MFRRQVFCIGTLATASLLLETTLTRLLAVSQFYHFAFLVISLALLGYGASGSILVIVTRISRLKRISFQDRLKFACFGFVLSVGIAYVAVNFLPFDSYSIAWNSEQIIYLGLYYFVLALPFLMSGFAVGTAIEANTNRSNIVYAGNLIGSGFGALLAPLAMWLAGVPGAILCSGVLGLVAVISLNVKSQFTHNNKNSLQLIPKSGVLCGMIVLGVLTILNFQSRAPLGLTLSPYKGLTQSMRYPGSKSIFSRWNAISKVDIIQGGSTHRLPGLSYNYQGEIPEQLGISIDAETPQPITLISPSDFDVSPYLPEALVFELNPYAKTLVIEPGGGLGILQALAGKAEEVVVAQENPLEFLAVKTDENGSELINDPRVQVIFEPSRVFLKQIDGQFDILYYPLTDTFRPVTSGAYSLIEDFNLTVESLEAAANRLSQDGILVVTRWIQFPPSESLRLAATMMTALENLGYVDIKDMFVMYRGIQTMTILMKPSGWDEAKMEQVRSFCADRSFDLVWMPGIKDSEINHYNIMQEPLYHLEIQKLINSEDKSLVYAEYPFDISPPTDDHPFFFHFFKWEQTPEVIASIGHTWQPFGGSGFLVLFVLLGIVGVFSILLIILPYIFLNRSFGIRKGLISKLESWKIFGYFSLLGFAFLFVEIPLIQKTILLFGQPIYAFTIVIAVILVSSGLGSWFARQEKISGKNILVTLVIYSILFPLFFPPLLDAALGWRLPFRILMVVLSIAPMALLMGMPFPLGLIALEGSDQKLFPWIWAINGSISVVASVVAAILILSYGFIMVQLLGGFFYLGATMIYASSFKPRLSKSNHGLSGPRSEEQI